MKRSNRNVKFVQRTRSPTTLQERLAQRAHKVVVLPHKVLAAADAFQVLLSLLLLMAAATARMGGSPKQRINLDARSARMGGMPTSVVQVVAYAYQVNLSAPI